MKRDGTPKKSLSAVAVGKKIYQHTVIVKVCLLNLKKGPQAHGKGACAGGECGFSKNDVKKKQKQKNFGAGRPP